MIEELLEFEKELWARANDPAFYAERLTDDALLVFPAPTGVIDRDATLAAVSQSAGWREFTVEDFRVVPLTGEGAAAAYKATATRPDGSTYAAYCSSAYVRGEPGWQLAVHQQTPLPQGAA
jgi:hypothetical protein